MRVLVIDKENSAAFQHLVRDRSARSVADLEKLNPHLDLKKAGIGTIVLVPDTLKVAGLNGVSLATDAFAALKASLLASIGDAGKRLQNAYIALASEEREVTEALGSQAMRRARAADPGLEEQVQIAMAVFKRDRQDAVAADELIGVLKKEVKAELDALEQMLA